MRQRNRLERTRWLLDFFEENRCVDCGEGDPLVLEFDHLRDKLFDIARGVDAMGWQPFLNEIEKCEVVCANCHARRTARRRRTVRFVLIEADEAGDRNRTDSSSLESLRANR